MQLLKQSWRHSLLAGIVGALMAPGLATAQEIEVEVEYRDGDRRVEEREIVVERRRALRDRDERRERDEQREREEVRERAEERERDERGERRVTERRIRRVFSSPEAAREFERKMELRHREIAVESERLHDQLPKRTVENGNRKFAPGWRDCVPCKPKCRPRLRPDTCSSPNVAK